MKTQLMMALACALAGTSAAGAAITIDGNVSASEYAGALTTYISYDAGAAGNFSAVGYSSNTTGYTIYYTADATNVYVGLKADADAGLNFANIYFDTDATLGSDLGFEVTNNDAFIPATGVKVLSAITGAGGSYSASAGAIEVSIPWAVFMTNELGLGQPLVAAGGALTLRSSQSFGYTVVGGTSATYHTTRLGTLTAPSAAAAVPEPASWAMMLGGFGLLGAAMRRRRTIDAIA